MKNCFQISSFAIFLFVIFATCNSNKYKTEEYDCDYSDCETVEPMVGDFFIKLTINDENSNVPIYIYKGNYEDNNILDTIFSEKDELYYEADLDKLYTLVAQYYKGNDTILVFDSKNFEKFSTYYCDSLCWTIKPTNFNLKLKF